MSDQIKKLSQEEVKKMSSKNFLQMLNREFTVNEIIDKYGNGGYASSPNTPGSNWQSPHFPYNQAKGLQYEEEQKEEPSDWTRHLLNALDKYSLDSIERSFTGINKKTVDQKKQVFKKAFIKMISEKINFDENGNIIDLEGKIVKSIGAFGLLFIRILNDVLDSKKSAEQHEADLKSILK